MEKRVADAAVKVRDERENATQRPKSAVTLDGELSEFCNTTVSRGIHKKDAYCPPPTPFPFFFYERCVRTCGGRTQRFEARRRREGVWSAAFTGDFAGMSGTPEGSQKQVNAATRLTVKS